MHTLIVSSDAEIEGIAVGCRELGGIEFLRTDGRITFRKRLLAELSLFGCRFVERQDQ